MALTPLALQIGPDTVLLFVLIAYSIILHEIAHGAAALWYGDPTARAHDRLTLNPLPHIDPIGTILVPLVLALAGAPVLGWAKPVPVNRYNLEPRVRGEIVVAVAGVAVNFLIAALVAAALPLSEGQLRSVLLHALFANVSLGVFNLLPIPPLDGSHVVAKLLPPGIRESYERIGFYGVFVLLLLMSAGAIERIVSAPVLGIAYFLLEQITFRIDPGFRP